MSIPYNTFVQGLGAATLAGTEEIAVVQGGVSKMATVSAVALAAGANTTPDTHPSSPTVFDDEFEFGSSIDLTGARRTGALPWAWTNQGTATTSVSQGSLVFGMQSSVGRNNAIAQMSLSGVSQPWTFTTKLQATQFPSAAQAGMIVQGSGGYLYFGISASAAAVIRYLGETLTNPTTLGTVIFSAPNPTPQFVGNSVVDSFPLYLQISLASNTYTMSASVTGVPGSFIALGTIVLSSSTVTTTNIGLCTDPEATTGGKIVVDWFRKTA